jgi:hypothetical protein
MPAPLGQQPRNRKFLLRMNEHEDAFVRGLAVTQHTSLNDVITGLIRDAMPPAAPSRTAPPEPPAPARAAPQPKPEPKKAARRPLKDRRKGSVKLTWSDVAGPPEPIPGQTAITDPDQ